MSVPAAVAAQLVMNVRGGSRLCVPGRTSQMTTYVLLEQEDWFEDEIAFMRRWLRPGMRAIDVGANLGTYTAAMAAAVGREGRVWAFEPAPETVELLERTLKLNGYAHATAVPSAVSDRTGSVEFALNPASELSAVATSPDEGRVTVAATTLDAAAARFAWSGIDFLKLDVEGHELRAIEGARAFLRAESPLLMLEVKSARGFDLGALAPLAELGYAAYRLIPGLNVLVPFAPEEPLDGYQLNLFACQPARASAMAREGFLCDGTEDTDGVLSAGVWEAYLKSEPYCRELGGSWPAKAGFFAAEDRKLYLEGLAAFAQAAAPGQRPAERHACLARALALVAESRATRDAPLRLLSYARIAAEIGSREAAVAAFAALAERLGLDSPDPREEPFLAPSLRYARISPSERAPEWLRCGVVEALERLRAYSSFFTGNSTLALVEPILEMPFCSPEMERRCQLVRMSSGSQAGPRATPRLCRASEENLNPEYWCREGRDDA